MNSVKKKAIFSIALILVTAAIVFIVSGCEFYFYSTYTGNAVNVKAEGSSSAFWKDEADTTNTLDGATVYLYAYDSDSGEFSSTESASATVANGTFSLYAASGKYKLTGSLSGWTFVPRLIEMSGSGSTSPDLLAYPTDSAGIMTIITSWTDSSIDVDSILTYGDNVDVAADNWTDGRTFTNENERLKISYPTAYRGSTDGIMLDRDVEADTSMPLVETMSIYTTDWFIGGDAISFYVDTPYSTDYLTGVYDVDPGDEIYESSPSPFAQVDIMYNGYHYGTWYLPWNTAESTIQIVEMIYNADDTFTIYSANNSDMLYGDGVIKSISLE